MALTNLTFGDSGNKALLCSYRDFMRALVIHLQSPSDELRQVHTLYSEIKVNFRFFYINVFISMRKHVCTCYSIFR